MTMVNTDVSRHCTLWRGCGQPLSPLQWEQLSHPAVLGRARSCSFFNPDLNCDGEGGAASQPSGVPQLSARAGCGLSCSRKFPFSSHPAHIRVSQRFTASLRGWRIKDAFNSRALTSSACKEEFSWNSPHLLLLLSFPSAHGVLTPQAARSPPAPAQGQQFASR